jgi:hypothetical protein
MTYAEALELADKTAKQYQISLGSDTLPRLLLRNLTATNQNSSNKLQQIQYLADDQRNLAVTYTGRIIVSLSDRCVRIEAHNNQLHQPNIIIEHKLNEDETNLQQLLQRITRYGENRNVQLLQLIDLNLLSSQSAYDEKKIFETLKERYDECVAYHRSLIVYNLDSLIGINKSESESSMVDLQIFLLSIKIFIRMFEQDFVKLLLKQQDQQMMLNELKNGLLQLHVNNFYYVNFVVM